MTAVSDIRGDSSADKSTNVRAAKPHAPRWFRAGFRLTAAVAPRLTARWLGRLFFTPPRARIRDEEYAVLAKGEPFSLYVRGERVNGYTWGDGPPVLLVHGWGGHAAHMTAFVKPLTKAGFRAVALDMPGHGQSGGRRSSLVHFAAAINAAGEHFGPLQGLIAHSLGAAGATYAMSRGLDVKRAVFFAPLARFDHIWARFREGLAIPDGVWRRFVEDSERWLKVRFEDIEPVTLARRMTTPLLVLHDPEDAEIPFEEGASLASHWPDATFHAAGDAGHLRILKNWRCIEAAAGFMGSFKI